MTFSFVRKRHHVLNNQAVVAKHFQPCFNSWNTYSSYCLIDPSLAELISVQDSNVGVYKPQDIPTFNTINSSTNCLNINPTIQPTTSSIPSSKIKMAEKITIEELLARNKSAFLAYFHTRRKTNESRIGP